MTDKTLDVVFYQQDWVRNDWSYELKEEQLQDFLQKMREELVQFGVSLRCSKEDFTIQIKGYGDLLNSVRLRFPSAGLGNLCLGHVIGASPNRNLLEDLRRGINRVVFAPETVEPDGSDKIVCHNCGCGC
jgi:hypothetical protein